MVERKQRGDGNCMFRSLAVAAGKKPEHHKELRRMVTDRMKAGPDKVSMKMLGTWGTSKVLQVAAEVMQVRIRVVQMDGAEGEPVETQIVGECGPEISVALYAQHMNALVHREVKLRCSIRNVKAVRNSGMLLVKDWGERRQKAAQKATLGRKKAEWKRDIAQTEQSLPEWEQITPVAAAAAGTAVATVCMMAVAASTAGKTVRQKLDWGTVMAVLVTMLMATAVIAAVSAAAVWRCQGMWEMAGTGVSATSMYTVSTGGWNSTGSREVKSALAFVAHIGDTPVVTGMDTYCETSAIRKSLVNPMWEILDSEPMPIKRVGSGELGPLGLQT